MTMTQGCGNGLIRILAAILITLWLTSTVCGADFTVIANNSVTENSLSRAELKAIFLGEKVKWENRKYIKIAILESGLAYVDFLQSVVGKTPSQFDQHWMKLVYTGRGSMPPSFTDAQQLIDYVAQNSNSIGVVAAGKVPGTVKVISIK